MELKWAIQCLDVATEFPRFTARQREAWETVKNELKKRAAQPELTLPPKFRASVLQSCGGCNCIHDNGSFSNTECQECQVTFSNYKPATSRT